MIDFLIFSDFPTQDNSRDGMIQRVQAIDDELSNFKRTYLKLSLWNFKRKINQKNASVVVYELNVIIHYFLINNLIRQSKYLYIHSLLNYFYAALFFVNKKTKLYLDFHGAVPEEYDFQGAKSYKVKIVSRIEKMAVKRCNYLICVSHNMKEHFIDKYPFVDRKSYIIKPILPSNLTNINDFDTVGFRKSLNISLNDIVLIYSGNLQKWQNFDLLVQTIKRNNNANYKYIILTNQVENAIEIIKNYGIDIDKIIIRSVPPVDLFKYYSISNYGFLLRDHHILNKVAAPTKLIEYLYYGLIPILKYHDIGDNNYYHFDFVSYENDDLGNLELLKSETNKKIATKILDSFNENKIISNLN